MPITLNHSNIAVQYSTGSNYIIETVKSDLYRRNEIVDTIVRDNIQVAPVTPTTFVDSVGNVYAIEAYTYTGSANTTDYARVFTKSTTCDILIVGGGGAGGKDIGAGGGGGAVLYGTNINIASGTYTIKVGRGGTPGEVRGQSSEAFGAVLFGGGCAGIANWNLAALANSGGSGAGGKSVPDAASKNGGTVGTSTKGAILTTATLYNGNVGGAGINQVSSVQSAGGGGAGAVGGNGNASGAQTGNGGAGVLVNITGVNYYWGGGGGGGGYASTPTNGGRGGGGAGERNDGGSSMGFGTGGADAYNAPVNMNGGAGSGGGGGGSGYNNTTSGNGGSGIVIIRYLLGTIPTTNYLTNEPVVIAPTFIETIRTFTHSEGAETQTTHNITVERDTICDILIVGGGGGGGSRHAGGGGAGSVIYLTNQTFFSGTYTIRVGKGGTAALTMGQGNKGEDSSISFNSTNIYLAKGGGAGHHDVSTGNSNKDGGSGGGSGGNTPGNPVSTNIPAGIYGNSGGILTNYNGGGGGGGGALTSGTNGTTTVGGNGGAGISISITGTAVTYGGGGGGGSLAGYTPGTGGVGGGGNGSQSTLTASSGRAGTGGGGGGGGFWESYHGPGGAGGSGIVIIKFKSLVGPIQEGVRHKRMNFLYNNDNLVAWYKFNGDYLDSSGNGHNLTNVGTVIQSTHIIEGQAVEFDSTDYLEFPVTINPYTIWNNGKGITFSCWVRFTAHETWARLIDFQTAANTSTGFYIAVKSNWSGTPGAILVNIAEGTLFTYSNWSNSIITTLGVWHHFVWSIDVAGKWDVYLNNVRINNTETRAIPNITYNVRYINRSAFTGDGTWDGQMDDFRIYDRAFSEADVARLYNKTYPAPNLYTLNFPVPTLADINNNSNIVLQGSYDIALNTRNAVVIPKTGQYIPKPTTFTNYSIERMYPPVRNFAAATTAVSGQTYGNGTYVVSYSTFLTTYEPFKCFNTSDTIGGHWVDNYTNGNYNGSANIVSGYLGDWLKIQLPVAIKLTRFEFKQRIDTLARAPKDFKIYGSNDNITWVELVNKTDAVYNASYMYIQLTPEITNAYTYYGLVVNKLLAGLYNTVLNFDEWYIYGQEVLPSSLSLRYNLLNTILDPIGSQWTYNTSNMNVYNMGSVGVGTTNPEYHLDVSGSLNAKTLMYNGSSINSLGLSVGMIAQVQHLTYTKMEVKDNTGWDAINEDLTSGFVIKITPKSSLSKMLVNLIVFIGMSTSADNAWWGIKLYRKIGTGSWTEITGCNGTETGSAAATAGTPVWISNNTGMVSYNESITNASGTYLDSPNTTATVYYTAYWNQRLGDNPSATGQMYLNRASSQNDAFRPAPSSSWTVEEIWYG